MKWKYAFEIVLLIALYATKSFAQNKDYSFIPSTHLTVTCNKTTNLIFPYSVQSVDRGSRDILVQQPKGTENIVQVKADKPNFTQTNLSVITIDGKLYSFIVDYDPQPSQLNIIIEKQNLIVSDSISMPPIKLSSGNNEALFQLVAKKIISSEVVRGEKDKHYQMKLQLNGIYIHNDVLYFRLFLQNISSISYDVSAVRFNIKDKQKSKRTATQELDLQPLYSYKSFTNIQSDSSVISVIALPKFTLPNSKYLSIQIFEKNGGRDLALNIKNCDIMKAKVITELK